MGTGIGLMQGRVIGGLIDKSSLWFWSCAAGLALPFLVTDISNAAGWSLAYSLPKAVTVGGIIVGGWQAFIFRSRLRMGWWWILASVLGWSLAAGTAAADALPRSSVRGIWGAVLYLGIVAAGGLVLGLITGVCLAWMFRNAPAD
jgi:hypothetical protein